MIKEDLILIEIGEFIEYSRIWTKYSSLELQQVKKHQSQCKFYIKIYPLVKILLCTNIRIQM